MSSSVFRLLRLPLIRHLRMIQLRQLVPLHKANPKLGTQVVRYYWHQFLTKNRADIRGHGLEIGTTETLRKYGGDTLTQADALDLSAHSPEVKVVADLTRADHVPSDVYDCFIIQFTMHVIYDVQAALYHSVRILKPGGALLINFASVDYYLHRGLDMGTGAPIYMFWWFTPLQVINLLYRAGLTENDFEITNYGNAFSHVAYTMNLFAEELTARELDFTDPGHPVLICVRVRKPQEWQCEKPAYQDPLWLPKGSPAKLHPLNDYYGGDYL